jgi:hypothetical protein
MARFIQLALEKRRVECVARLLEDEAPRTCRAVWDALPLSGDAFHAKYARNEVYTLLAPFAAEEPGLENPTITPIPGDVLYFHMSGWQLSSTSHGYTAGGGPTQPAEMVDLAFFYARNNLLLNPDYGFVPGSVFATIVRGLEAMAAASHDLWRSGSVGERLTFTRVESG